MIRYAPIPHGALSPCYLHYGNFQLLHLHTIYTYSRVTLTQYTVPRQETRYRQDAPSSTEHPKMVPLLSLPKTSISVTVYPSPAMTHAHAPNPIHTTLPNPLALTAV